MSSMQPPDLIESPALTYGQLGAQLYTKMTGVVHDHGILNLPCPLCNGTAALMLDATDEGDGVWCFNGCDETRVESALRFLVQRLPGRCPDHERFPNKQCARCLTYSTLAQRAFRQLHQGGAEEGVQDEEPILSSLVDAEPVPDPSILRLPDGTHLLRRGWVHLFHGKPFCGKTPLTYLAVVEVAKAGGVVLLVDYEMGGSGAKALLMELGLTEDQIRDHVLYAYNPRRWTQTQRDKLAVEVAARAPDLVVIDSLSRSMATAGLNQNDATETDAWFHSLPTWAVDQFGSAVMLIDHTTRTDGPHPSGSIQKTAAPQFHVWVQNVHAFSRDHEDGCSLLTVQKDRSGQRQVDRPVAELRTELGGSFVLREVDGSRTATRAVGGDEVDVDLGALSYRDQLRLDVMTALQEAGPRGLLTGDITGGSGADSQQRKKALDWLVDRQQVVSRRETGTARGRRFWAAEFAPGDANE